MKKKLILCRRKVGNGGFVGVGGDEVQWSRRSIDEGDE
ncbi:hypothetical protein A2U01_0071905, partial [Trifolium medium]|nr:hypothetical protein [Trifolium medium]